MKEPVVVVIIAHKDTLSHWEKASLHQCYKILGGHPIRLVCPQGLNVSIYMEVNPMAEIIFIDPVWLSSYNKFNELKKNKFLYNLFGDYKYLLFYELDAWVFSDKLEYWCAKKYDYIGAPWFEGWGKATIESNLSGIGNGGFSLRNIQSAKRILKRLERLKLLRKFWFKSRIQAVWRFDKFLKWLSSRIKINDISLLHRVIFSNNLQIHEDHFWSDISNFFSDFNLPGVKDAVDFSFEVNPSLLFKINNDQLPFGCHAWQKYEPEFWKTFIFPLNNA